MDTGPIKIVQITDSMIHQYSQTSLAQAQVSKKPPKIHEQTNSVNYQKAMELLQVTNVGNGLAIDVIGKRVSDGDYVVELAQGIMDALRTRQHNDPSVSIRDDGRICFSEDKFSEICDAAGHLSESPDAIARKSVTFTV